MATTTQFFDHVAYKTGMSQRMDSVLVPEGKWWQTEDFWFRDNEAKVFPVVVPYRTESQVLNKQHMMLNSNDASVERYTILGDTTLVSAPTASPTAFVTNKIIKRKSFPTRDYIVTGKHFKIGRAHV